jgi:hypothetical protein
VDDNGSIHLLFKGLARWLGGARRVLGHRPDERTTSG